MIFVHVDLSVGSITTRRTDKRSTPSGCPTTSDRFAQRALGGHPERLNDIRSAQSDTYAAVEGYCRKARLPNPNLARYGMGQRFRVSSSPARCCRCLCRHSGPKLIRNLRVAEGLNTITRRGEIGTGTLVLGLRPIRWPFLRTTNEPNDDSFTVSPRSRQSVTSLSTNSKSLTHSVRDRPNFR